MKEIHIREVERTWVSVPLKTRHARHLVRENWNWTVFEIIRLSTDSGLTGFGETMCYYTWGQVPKEQIERVKGKSPFEFLWDDSLGAGLQMAVYDLAGKALEVPCYRLVGPKAREWCPISWWSNDMTTEDWMEEIREALSLGYTSAKLKARPWRDFRGQMEKLDEIVPSGFRFDADFNSLLRDAPTAVPYLLELEKIPHMAIFESPIPQSDVDGGQYIRSRIHRPVAVHYGNPDVTAAVRSNICDGFVIGGGADLLRRQGDLSAEMNHPFWLQMVGTGLTTAFMLHFAAALSHATWPAITCHDMYEDDLLKESIEIRQGYARVPETPGMGVEPDEDAIERYRVEEGYEPPMPPNLYRVSWPNGAAVIYPPGKSGIKTNHHFMSRGVWDDFTAGNHPLFEPGVQLEILPDDGSKEWKDLKHRTLESPVRE